MLQHPAAVRAAFEDATSTLLTTIERIEPHQWELPGLGVWSVRELAAHTLRAMTTIERYLDAEPTVDRLIVDAIDYYRVALADSRVHAGVAERGRTAGVELTDPVGECEATTERVLALVASTADDDVVETSAGKMMFIEYLATRATELGLHTLDLQRASGQPQYLPPATSSMVVGLMAALAEPIMLLSALTGRGAMPPDYNVLR
ncbi:MAG TPA: maleylpyruvate isomerase N-terminal domain-containing protein [Ilumatobacteraceae bacterium]|nr:maleylpyruvate isomerase N-terminal domain-containing protein [Ilumatobacteraceae bacterium]